LNFSPDNYRNSQSLFIQSTTELLTSCVLRVTLCRTPCYSVVKYSSTVISHHTSHIFCITHFDKLSVPPTGFDFVVYHNLYNNSTPTGLTMNRQNHYTIQQFTNNQQPTINNQHTSNITHHTSFVSPTSTSSVCHLRGLISLYIIISIIIPPTSTGLLRQAQQPQ